MMRRYFPLGVTVLAWMALASAQASVLQRVFSFGSGAYVTAQWNLSRFVNDVSPPAAQNPQTLAIRYRLCSDGWSGAGAAAAELNAVRAAFGIWQSVPGLKVTFEELPAVPGITDVNPNDGTNTVAWLSGGAYYAGGALFLPSLVTGFTAVSALDDGTIVEADIMLNSNFTWFPQFDTNNINGFFIEATALHEIGHLLGLNHSAVGGSTMFYTTTVGVNWTDGLSSDDVTAVLGMYGTAARLAQLSSVQGRVTLGGQSVLGALLTLEDTNGVVAAGTVSLQDGTYRLSAIPPGNYRLRVAPMDPNGSGDAHLVRGLDLDIDGSYYSNSVTAFQIVTNLPITLKAGAASVQNVAVTAGSLPFRITETRWFLNPADRTSGDYTPQVALGVSNQWVGVYVPSLADTNAVLGVTGPGITVGPTRVLPHALRTLTLVQAPFSVASNAPPGLRTLSVTSQGATAYASGFLEVLPPVYDYNFDGLDDLFQRRYWSPFTIPAAAPGADPDGDGFTNVREYQMGSDPTNPLSVNWRILSTTLSSQGTTVVWQSAPNHYYQVFSRDDLAGSTWQPVGSKVLAPGETNQLLDVRPASRLRFYQVRDAQ